jgi:hypothetical protein
MAKGKLHFGHPMNSYNTGIEERLIKVIKKTFLDYELDNCNQPKHQKAAKEWYNKTHKKMSYFYQVFIPEMAIGVFLPFRDGMYGAGVYGEAVLMRQFKKPIYQISLDGKITELELDAKKRLSIKETLRRLVNPY